MDEYYRVFVNIDLNAIRENVNNVKKLIKKDTKVMTVIKADGYGHGAVKLAKVLDPYVDAYGVAILEEAIELRKSGVKKPILILGYSPACNAREVVEYRIWQTVFQYDAAKALSDEALKQGTVAEIHIKLDTGMSRIGFSDTEESVDEVVKISKLKGIKIVGCFTHFARADETDLASAKKQFERYQGFIEKLEAKGIHIPIKHISNSAAIQQLPEANMDMVRLGISTYGIYPSDDVPKDTLQLQPAMEWKARVSYVKQVKSGTQISYGGTYVADKERMVATIPVGYADGYPRSLSSRGRVLIHGKSAPILGRVCMDQFMVDVTEIQDVKQGDLVTLMGRDGHESISVEEISEMAYSFPYEFICDVGKRVARRYINE